MIKRIRRAAAAVAVAGVAIIAGAGCIPTLVGQSNGHYNQVIKDSIVAKIRANGTAEDNPNFYVSVKCRNNNSGVLTTRNSSAYNMNGMPASTKRTDASGDYYLVSVECQFGETVVDNSAVVVRF